MDFMTILFPFTAQLAVCPDTVLCELTSSP